jgi:septum formation protein
MKRHIILASKSPRRKELMTMAGFDFEIRSKDVREDHPEDTAPELIPVHLATKKAIAFIDEIAQNEIVIGADTVVLLDGKIYEKPVDRSDAIQMLTALSGQVHQVVTGVCILSKEKQVTFSETTKVHFHPLALSEIEYYVDNFKPYDKAGSYACQEWIGAIGIKAFDGDYFNVKLPLAEILQHFPPHHLFQLLYIIQCHSLRVNWFAKVSLN